jgi:hypothetical protein
MYLSVPKYLTIIVKLGKILCINARAEALVQVGFCIQFLLLHKHVCTHGQNT